MNLKEKLLNNKAKVSIIGLGYVGMPLSVEFAKYTNVIGFDINEEKINLYKSGIDPTKEVGNDIIKNTTVNFTNKEEDLKEVDFHMVAVPTPIKIDKTPDLTPVEGASKVVGRNLKKGAYVVFESTVYPGVTEDVCIPILEKESGLKCGDDFKVGYSPERINPGDKINTLDKIIKIVSGVDEEALDVISDVYEIVIKAGVHKASSIKVAEAAKVVENSQRDINIAFMNELAKVFNKMGINTNEVVEAMRTKWNSLPFTPGLVGGHCIGVDPYYFLYQAEKLGYHSQIIQSGRRINDSMGDFVAHAVIKKLIEANKKVKESKVVICGVTFKEDCPDTRNSKVFDIVKGLNEYGIEVTFVDEQADRQEAKEFYGIDILNIDEVKNADCLVFAVAHKEFKELGKERLAEMYNQNLKEKERVLIDVKGIFTSELFQKSDMKYWSL
ncbi:nucleotide sugar dehydrogenase [Aliicoccus persicus]|uniref:UDP-N-acetyl-D-galactosamine dehydrogenase n=1 Tax=Aliicoccus persicus TaxID=930138 RepID=A0A662YZY8_9STAP|nr:nucleotide sugar dehydrogenase [Aliicoccus persicus]SEV79711.1 UDP-N-acetyl-D-galactosamine dehydrogenase [Aliicoccus persicus]